MRQILEAAKQNADTYIAGYKKGFAQGLKVFFRSTCFFWCSSDVTCVKTARIVLMFLMLFFSGGFRCGQNCTKSLSVMYGGQAGAGAEGQVKGAAAGYAAYMGRRG